VAVQLARHLGAEVFATASARNADFVKGLGASRVVDYAKEDFAEVLSDLDVVLESLGGDSIARSLRTLRRGGALASINSGLPDATERLGPTLGLLSVGTRIAWTMACARLGRGVRFRTVVRKPDGEALARLAELANEGAIVPTVAEVFSLERIADAHRSLETGRTRGKIAIEIARPAG
jgi:NADPH:quinone reductase-like Zn-dependent oxidoreductase